MRILSLILCLVGLQALGQDKFEKLDRYLAELENEESFSGVVLIGQNGQETFSKTLGYADKEMGIRPSLDTQFNLSSGSKLFTGVGILKLVQEGKISVEDKIGEYFPELEYGDRVTVHHLLTHSSGLSDFFKVEGFSYKNVKNCQDVIPFIENQQLLFSPGDSVYYSTSGMVLLGALIEKISGSTYQEYIRENILQPLGMSHTSFINYVQASESTNLGDFAKGHVKNDQGEIVKQKFNDRDREFVPLSAGGVWTSASDLLKFDHGVYSYKILKKEFVDLMTGQYTFTGWPGCYFGYVWITINSGKNEALGHAGNSRGHHSNFFHYKTDGSVMIVLTNYGFADVFLVAENIEKILYH